MSVQALQSACPSNERQALQSALANVPAHEQPRVSAVIGSLVDTIKSMGLSVNWGCLFSIIPQALAAFSNPVLWPGVIAAYFACANPPTPGVSGS